MGQTSVERGKKEKTEIGETGTHFSTTLGQSEEMGDGEEERRGNERGEEEEEDCGEERKGVYEVRER